MSEEQRALLIGQVAQLYYEQGVTQESIAARLRLSRPTISRLLREARDLGIVQIIVRRPLGLDGDLETDLLRTFPELRSARILAGVAELAEDAVRRNLARVAARYVSALVREGDTIGVSWGETMEDVSAALPSVPVRNVTVVQLKGGVSRADEGTNAARVVERFGGAFGAEARLLPVPSIVESPLVRDALMADRHVAPLLALARQARIAVFGIGVPEPGTALHRAGYLSAAELERLRARGAVGDICSRFLTIDGQLADPELEGRTVGISLPELGAKEAAVCVACGVRKARAVLGALRGGYLNVLITDEDTAGAVLRLHREGGAA